MKFTPIVSFLLLCVIITSCDAKTDPVLKFDTSDVSFLLPLPNLEKPDEGIRIRFSDAGDHGPVLSEENFKRLPLFPIQFDDMDEAYRNAHITAVRLIPCVPGVDQKADPENCVGAHLRLVGQIIEPSATGPKAADAALHLLYAVELSPEFVSELLAIKKESQRLGIQTTGAALGVHPALRGEYWKNAERLALGEQIITFLLKYVGENTQIRVAVMSTRKSDSHKTWEWTRAVFDQPSKRILVESDEGYGELRETLKIGHVTGEHFSQSFTAEVGSRKGRLSARSTKFPEIAKLLEDDPPSPADEPKAYDQAHAIENPWVLTTGEADCVSCHVATPYRLAGELKWGQLRNAQTFVAPEGLTQTMQKETEAFMARRLHVVINFGFLAENPSISQRTVNESAEAARFLNQNFVLSKDGDGN